MRVRILPLLILFAALTLGVRVGEIWQGFGGIAEAQGDAASVADFVTDPFAASTPGRQQIAQAQPEGEPAKTDDESEAGADTAAAKQPQDLLANADPLAMSDAEIELLQQLSARRKELDQRESALERREGVVQAAEKRLNDKVAELDRLRGEIEALLVKYDNQEDQQLTRLVNIYESMKPKDAARIFEDLEMEVLLKVVERMKERNTAPILAEMRSDKAQELTLELAEREDLPLPRE